MKGADINYSGAREKIAAGLTDSPMLKNSVEEAHFYAEQGNMSQTGCWHIQTGGWVLFGPPGFGPASISLIENLLDFKGRVGGCPGAHSSVTSDGSLRVPCGKIGCTESD